MTAMIYPVPDPRLPAWYCREEGFRSPIITDPDKQPSPETLRARRLRKTLDQNPDEDLVLRIDRPPIECPKTWTKFLRMDRIWDFGVLEQLEKSDRLDPLSTENIHSILLHRSKVNYQERGWSREQYHSKMVDFFKWQRVWELLFASLQRRNRIYIRADLSFQLRLTGRGQNPALWRYHVGWLKARILECFHEKDLPADRWTLLLYYRIPLDEILKLPLRDPGQEPEETLWPDF